MAAANQGSCCAPPENRKRGPGPGPESVPRSEMFGTGCQPPLFGRSLELFQSAKPEPHLIPTYQIGDCRNAGGHPAQSFCTMTVLIACKHSRHPPNNENVEFRRFCMHAFGSKPVSLESNRVSRFSWANRPHPRIRSIVLLGRGLTAT